MGDKKIVLTLGSFRLRRGNDNKNLVLEEWKEAVEEDTETKQKVRKEAGWTFVGFYSTTNPVHALTAMAALTLEAGPFLQAYEGFQQQLVDLADQFKQKINAQD